MFRTSIVAIRPSLARRALHASPTSFKTVKETVAEVADSVRVAHRCSISYSSVLQVNKKVGKGLASALETGQKAAETTKETVGSAAEQTKYKTNETSAQAAHKIVSIFPILDSSVDREQNQATSGAKQAKEDFEKEVKK